MDNIIAIKTNCYKGLPIQQTYQGIADAGFKNVEISFSLNSNSGIDRFKAPEQLEAFKEHFQKLGLTPSGAGGHIDITNKALEEDFIANIKLANYFGIKYLVVSVGASNDDPRNLSDELVAETIKKFIPLLQQYDVTLLLETHWKHATGMKLKPICDLVDSPYCKICYDCGNVIFYDGLANEEIIADFRRCVSQIGYIHLKDKAGSKNEWNFPALGQGYGPVKDIIQLVKEYKLACPITVEIEYTASGVKDVFEADKAVKDSYQYLENIYFEK